MSTKKRAKADSPKNRIDPDRLKSMRTKSGLNQTDYAKLAGIDHSLLSKLENGKGRKISLEIAWRIADAGSVSLDWLCGR